MRRSRLHRSGRADSSKPDPGGAGESLLHTWPLAGRICRLGFRIDDRSAHTRMVSVFVSLLARANVGDAKKSLWIVWKDIEHL